MKYKPILIAPLIVAVLTMVGATTTHAYATIDCSQSNDPRCQQATSSPPDFSHHSGQDVAYCIASGSLLLLRQRHFVNYFSKRLLELMYLLGGLWLPLQPLYRT